MAGVARPPLPGEASAGAARLLRAQLRYADAAAARIARGGDLAALHDYRVSLRRLRALAKAFAPELRGRVGRGLRRRMRRLARRTGAGRDAEVMLAWLDRRTGRLPGIARPRADDWRRSLADARDREARRLRGELPGRHARLARRLRLRLARPRPPGAALAFTRVWEERLFRARARWSAACAIAAAPGAPPAALHAARIAGKNFRYLLEPRPAPGPADRRALRRLKRLQTLLGEWHDRHLVVLALAGLRALAPVRRLARAEAAALAVRFRNVARRSG